MSSPDDREPGRRLLLVHAHPDDESIGTGATMAKYAAEGVQVTCTLGELGEIIPPSLAQLAAEKEDRLGEYRIGELAAACDVLGVTDHRFLGGPGRGRAPGALLGIIREVQPQVLVTYDANGFYGHPDHIQAHRVAWRAFELAGADGPGRPARFYATAAPDSAQLTTEIDATGYFEVKLAAIRAHATQITVSEPFFALSNQVRQRALGVEYYTLLAGPAGQAAAPGGRETGLF